MFTNPRKRTGKHHCRSRTLITPPGHQSIGRVQQISAKPSTSSQSVPVLANQTDNIATSRTPLMFSPEAVRPLPKALPTKISNRGRKTRKSSIYTDTPEKEENMKRD